MKQLVEKDPMKDFLKYGRELEEREWEHELALARLIMGQPSMSSTPKLINVQHPGYSSQPTHHYSSHSNGAYGIATQGSSPGSFLHGLIDFQDISCENITKLYTFEGRHKHC